jgi:hypothetical protein
LAFRLLELAGAALDDNWQDPLDRRLTRDLLAPALNRHRVTTMSSHIPGIDVSWDKWPNLLKQAMLLDDIQRRRIIPYEVLVGLKMDLNRWIGNGRDDNNNKVVDEPYEQEISIWPTTTADGSSLPADFAGSQFHYENLQRNNTTDYPMYAKQVYARHLYCLMLGAMDQNWKEPPTVDGNASADAGIQRTLKRRRIAQWAINAVDFRDPDSTMTPFEYDSTPEDGWQNMDGDPGTDEGGQRRIVWGCEYPDLILTEALAYHDRRVADKDTDDGGTPGQRQDKNGRLKEYEGTNTTDGVEKYQVADETLDQFRVPQGSLFLEFYATGPAPLNSPQPARELYVTNGNVTALNLGAVTPTSAGLQYPVWRVAVTTSFPQENSMSDPETPPDEPRSVAALLDRYNANAKPDTTDFIHGTTYQNQRAMALSATGGGGSTQIERIIWFAPLEPQDTHHADTTGGSTPEDPPMWHRIYYNRSGNAMLPVGTYGVVGPRETTHLGSQPGTTPVTGSDKSIIIGPNSVTVPNGVTSSTPNCQLGIVAASRPDIVQSSDAYPVTDGWGDWADSQDALEVYSGQNGVGISVSEPLPSNYYPAPNGLPDGAPPEYSDAPADAYRDAGTGEPIALAEPLEQLSGGSGDFPLNDDPTLISSGTRLDYKTALLQRLADPTQTWHPSKNPYITVDWIPIDLTVFNGEDDDTDFEDIRSGSNNPSDDTKIIVNESDGNPIEQDEFDLLRFDVDDPHPFLTEFGDDGEEVKPYPSRERGSAEDGTVIWTSAPNVPDPDRMSSAAGSSYYPYAIVHSLGGVKAELSGRTIPWITWNNRPFISPMELMLVPWSSPGRLLHEFSVGNSSDDPYLPRTMGLLRQDTDPLPVFGHLMDFYATDGDDENTDGGAPDYYRIFDFVDVPSRFVGTETWYNPAVFFSEGNASPLSMWPPYCKLSRFREPGRVNINTITDPVVWRAVSRILNATAATPEEKYLESDQMFRDIAQSRTEDGPFRSMYRGAGLSLLRSDPDDAEDDKKLLRSYPRNDQESPTRNAFFEMDGIQRVYNSLTTKSNCYAIWITVGYFECDANGQNIRQELGSDTGNIKRHRAFYIVDRSIPVAYEAGQRNNIDKCVLLKRFIE